MWKVSISKVEIPWNDVSPAFQEIKYQIICSIGSYHCRISVKYLHNESLKLHDKTFMPNLSIHKQKNSPKGDRDSLPQYIPDLIVTNQNMLLLKMRLKLINISCHQRFIPREINSKSRKSSQWSICFSKGW